jgi:lipoate-protein ligase A
MRWRVVGLETNTAQFNMAIDHAIMDGIISGNSDPTIRFYKWRPCTVSIGRFQSMKEEVDVERCDALGISYVRRATGGGAVYHDYGGEITYSIIAKEEHFPKGIRESYGFVCGSIIKGLENIGIRAEFAPINDIVVDGKKISGNAQTRRGGVLLQHGTVLYDLDIKTMFSVLKISKEKISDKLIKSVEERVTSVSKHSDISQDGLYLELRKSFTAGRDYYIGKYTHEELERAEDLIKNIYGSDDWNFSR